MLHAIELPSQVAPAQPVADALLAEGGTLLRVCLAEGLLAVADVATLLAASNAAAMAGATLEVVAARGGDVVVVDALQRDVPRRRRDGRTLAQWIAALQVPAALPTTPRDLQSGAQLQPALISSRLTPSGGDHLVPRITVLASPATRWLKRLSVTPERLAEWFASAPACSPQRLEHWLLARADAQVAEERRAATAKLDAASRRVGEACQTWQHRILAQGLVASAAAAELHRALRILHVQCDEMARRRRHVLRRHAVYAARHLCPWGHWQDTQLSADWLAEQLGSPQALAAQLAPATTQLHTHPTHRLFVLT